MMVINYQEVSKNINIPQGREMVKWQPFATMPEQYENIVRLMDDNIKVEKPLLNDEQRVNNEKNLKESLNKSIGVGYWSNGLEVELECRLESINRESQLILISKNGQFIYIDFDYIYAVIKMDYLLD